MSVSSEWLVAVFKCNSNIVKKVLVEVYRFVDDLKGVRSLHFLVRDRVEEEVVFCFRVMIQPLFKEMVKNKLADKLGTLLPKDKYSIDPTVGDSFEQYLAWFPEKRIAEVGQNKFELFIDLLKNLSEIVVQLVENDYFASSERVELAHLIPLMFGCTEYGLLSTSGMEIGYYDRIEDKYCSYLKQDFPKSNEKPNSYTKDNNQNS